MTRNAREAPELSSVLDPHGLPYTAGHWRGDLPHLHKAGATYFVTFCLHDAVPARLQRRRSLDDDPGPEAIAGYSEPPASSPSRLLANPGIAALMEDVLLSFNGERYLLHAWCVMPDHVHAVVTPLPEHSLSGILHSWKSFAAHRINQLAGRKGQLWESESFDHLVRNDEQLQRFVTYVERNPVAAGLCPSPELWPASSSRLRTR